MCLSILSLEFEEFSVTQTSVHSSTTRENVEENQSESLLPGSRNFQENGKGREMKN